MNVRVSDRRPRKTLTRGPRKANEFSGFVMIDENGDSQSTLNLDLEEQLPPEGFPRGRVPEEDTVTAETRSKVALTDQKNEDRELPPHALRRLLQKEERWRIERSNTLSEEKMITLDRLQDRLSAILGLHGNVVQREGPRQMRVFRTLAEVLPEPAEGPRVIDSESKAVPANENSATKHTARRISRKKQHDVGGETLSPLNNVETSEGGTQRESVREGPKTSVPSNRISLRPRNRESAPMNSCLESPHSSKYVTFGQPDPDEIESPANGESGEEDRAPVEGSTQDHRRPQNDFYRNLCSICGLLVPVHHGISVELNGYHYHKRCLVDLYFTQEELFFALRSRCRMHPLNAKPKKKLWPWQRITRRFLRFFNRK